MPSVKQTVVNFVTPSTTIHSISDHIVYWYVKCTTIDCHYSLQPSIQSVSFFSIIESLSLSLFLFYAVYAKWHFYFHIPSNIRFHFSHNPCSNVSIVRTFLVYIEMLPVYSTDRTHTLTHIYLKTIQNCVQGEASNNNTKKQVFRNVFEWQCARNKMIPCALPCLSFHQRRLFLFLLFRLSFFFSLAVTGYRLLWFYCCRYRTVGLPT